MKKVEKIQESRNFTAVYLGSLDELGDYSFLHPKTGNEVNGKVFVNQALKATATEISFNTLPPHTELPYFHFHRKIEETYIFLKGSGFFQVDEDCFPISEGSVVRVAPEGIRGFCNSSDDSMIYICIQGTLNSLEAHTTEDGERIAWEPKWDRDPFAGLSGNSPAD